MVEDDFHWEYSDDKPKAKLIESQGKNTNLCSVPWYFILYPIKVMLFAAWINDSITPTRQPFQFVQHVSAKHGHWVRG